MTKNSYSIRKVTFSPAAINKIGLLSRAFNYKTKSGPSCSCYPFLIVRVIAMIVNTNHMSSKQHVKMQITIDEIDMMCK